MRMLMMPTLILVEDTHWLDDASQLVLCDDSRRPAPRPWLIVATRRPFGAAARRRRPRSLELEPLAAGCGTRARASPAAGRGVALGSRRSRPSPTARPATRSSSASSRRAGGTRARCPETVERLLTSRIDTLHPTDRLLLRHASVIGRPFDLDLLAEILAGRGSATPEQLGPPRRLRRSDGADRAAVPARPRSATPPTRPLLHAAAARSTRAVGAALERRAPDPSRDAEVLSLHFLAAGRVREGVAVRRARPATTHARSTRTSTRRRSTSARSRPRTSFDVARRTSSRGCARRSATCASSPRATTRPTPRTSAGSREGGSRAAAAAASAGSSPSGRAATTTRSRLYDDAADRRRRGGGRRARTRPGDRPLPPGEDRRLRPYWTEKAAEAAQSVGDREALANAYYIRAAAEGDRGGPARDLLDRALPIFEELGLLHRQASS